VFCLPLDRIWRTISRLTGVTTPPVPLRTAVIIGSTRAGRVGGVLGRWFAEQATLRADLDLFVVDLADFDFPAGYPEVPTAEMARFTGTLADADAFVVVTPEYNHSFPASLKQAVDYGYDEWHAKPVGFVSYGCRSTGGHAVEQLRAVFTELHAMPLCNTVGVDLLDGRVDDTGRPTDTPDRAPAVTALLDQLVWWGDALRDARAKRPYVG
jgi:NAD(P)H-dependent FMN reductase